MLQMAPFALLAPTTLVVFLLPVAKASCPCPDLLPPAAKEVCASDRRTYASMCHLDCAALPGLSLLYPGPCSSTERVNSLPTHGTPEAPRRQATMEVKKLTDCFQDHRCGAATCSECAEGDAACRAMCQRRCECGCGSGGGGLPTGAPLDQVLFDECRRQRGCGSKKYLACGVKCRTQECVDECWLSLRECECECVREASAQLGNNTSPGGQSSPSIAATPTSRGDDTSPSALVDGALGRLLNASLLTRGTSGRQRRSATEELTRWGNCKRERQCATVTCGECGGDDAGCRAMCWWNCQCGCGGQPRGGMDHELWMKCCADRGCYEEREACETGCKGREWACWDQCSLGSLRCACECVQQVGNAAPSPPADGGNGGLASGATSGDQGQKEVTGL